MKKNNINKIQLNRMDCLKMLGQTESNSVDLVLIDPPYDISQKGVSNRGRTRDFGSWDHGSTNMKKVCEEAYRVLRNGGTLICFYDVWKVTTLKDWIEKANFKQLRMIEWIKTNPFPAACNTNYILGTREIAVTAVKGSKATFNSYYDKGIYTYPICQAKDRFHTTQKPLDLITELVRKHSNEGDLVLDCFSGSGTTAVACVNTNRNFIGCEKDKTYFEKSIERLEKAIDKKVCDASFSDCHELKTAERFVNTANSKAA